MNPPHAIAILLITPVLNRIFQEGWVVRIQLPFVVAGRSDPFPDFAVVRGSPRTSVSHPSVAELIIEVSDTTLTFDLTEKAEAYAVSQIPEYWVLDIEGRKLLVFRDPQPIAANGNSYRTQLTFGPEDSVSPLAAPQALVRVADLLP